MKVDIGIKEADRKKIADSLSHFLGDTYLLYSKTQVFHWNVTGMHFHSLHTLFETQYNELALAIDEIAERIRALGFLVQGGLSSYQKLAEVKESANNLEAQAMVKQLVKDHETCVRTARETLVLANKVDDQPTVDLMTTRMQTHEKTAWMLRSLLD